MERHTRLVCQVDWIAELRDLAGEQWHDVADQAPTLYSVWGGGGVWNQQSSKLVGTGAVGSDPFALESSFTLSSTEVRRFRYRGFEAYV
jgi:hypothetical protein